MMCFEGTLTGAVFLQFLDEFLVPVLKPGQIVILDKAHKVAGVRERMEGAGARVLYLPPYSPDLNPIEMAWSKISYHPHSGWYEEALPGRAISGEGPIGAI
jgi:transposase